MDAELEGMLETLQALEVEGRKAGDSLRDGDSWADVSDVPSFVPPPIAEGAADFDLRGELGQGGMAIVRVAEQVSLQREVALKTARPELRTSQASLVREAIITGQLEHPNIVPVHAMVTGVVDDDHDDDRSDEAAISVVMKRVVGRSWTELFCDPSVGLDRHLTILEQVCNAIAFAHSRGIVHLDLKPDNIMIGDFGEVYVMDWGIARRVSDPDNERIFGTPSYMPPEMTRGLFSPASDVFQLGAVLYEILAGRPLYEGDLVESVRAAVACAPPRFPPSAPSELVDICRHACARFEHERHETVAEFRDEIAAFRAHRVAVAFVARGDEARQRFEALATASAARDGGLLGYPRAQAVFSEARRAYEHALEAWSESSAAAEGLRRLLCQMVDYEASLGHVDAAAALLEAIDSPPLRLRDAVDAAKEVAAESRARIERLERDGDVAVGADARWVAFRTMALAALILTVTFVVSRATRPEFVPSTSRLLTVGATVLAIGSAVVAWWWSTGLNQVNRHLAVLTVGMLAASCGNRAVAHLLGFDSVQALITDAMLLGLGGFAFALFHPAGRWLTGIAAVIIVVGAIEPTWVDDVFVAVSVSVSAFVALRIAVLRRRGRRATAGDAASPEV